MTKQLKIFIFSVTLLLILTIIVYVINDSLYYSIVEYIAKDKALEHPEAGSILKKMIISLLFKVIILLSLFGIITYVNWRKYLKSVKLAKIIKSLKNYLQRINNNKWSFVIILFLGISFLLLSIFFILNMDVGTDEGYYISAIKNFYISGKFKLPWAEDFFETRNQLIFIPFFLLKHIIPFTIELPRIVIVFYTIVLFLLLYFFYRRHQTTLGFVIVFVLLVGNPNFMFVSSSAFLEIPTLLFLFVGLYLFTRTNIKYKAFISALFVAYAGLSKLQILPIIVIVFVIMYIIDNDNRKKYFYFMLYLFIIWFCGTLLFLKIQGYPFIALFKILYFLINSSGAAGKMLPIFARISHIAVYFQHINIVIFCIVLLYIVYSFKRFNQFKKVLALIFVFNSFWWIFILPSLSSRNLIYAIVISYILFSDSVVYFYNKVVSRNYKMLYLTFISIFLVMFFINGIIFSTIQIKKGISDEYLLSVNGYQSPFGNNNTFLESYQQDFYEEINKLSLNRNIYWISMDYNKYLFTEREFLRVNRKSQNNYVNFYEMNTGSFFILTYLDYRNNYVWDKLKIYLNNNTRIIYKKGFWEIYEITK